VVLPGAYAITSIALRVTGAHKSHLHDKVSPRRGEEEEVNSINLLNRNDKGKRILKDIKLLLKESKNW
jgi:hypothetical protein